MRINGALAALAIALFLLPALPKAAAPGTYTGEATVTSQSEQERDAALRTALGRVVVDIVGDPDVLGRNDVAQALGKASHYMLQYSYRQTGSADDAGLRLVAEFDRAAVDSMLDSLGLASPANGGPEPGGVPQAAVIWISGLESSADYARVMQYLQHSNLVQDAQPLEVRGDGMSVKLSLSGDLQHFLQAVQIENRLQVISEQPPIAGIDATLSARGNGAGP